MLSVIIKQASVKKFVKRNHPVIRSSFGTSAKKDLFRPSFAQARMFGTNAKIFSKSEIERMEFEEFGTFKSNELKIQKNQKTNWNSQVGSTFTDHMLAIDWSLADGWHRPQILPFAPIPVHPCSSSLQYGMSCYGDLNIHKNRETGELQAFQPDLSLQAILNSTHSLDMPLFETEQLFQCMKHLVNVDKDWFPAENGHLNIRMCHFSTEDALPLISPRSSKLICLMSQVKMGDLQDKSVSLKCSDQQIKSWPLSHGQYNIGANLAPLAPAINQAQNQDFDDVLWLLDDFILETTHANIFVILRNRQGEIEWITPPSDSAECIRPSVTLQTIIDLKEGKPKSNGDMRVSSRTNQINEFVDACLSIIDHKEGSTDFPQNGTSPTKISQRSISVHEFMSAYREGRLIEAFLCSDQEFIQPISKIGYMDQVLEFTTEHKFADQINSELKMVRESSSEYVRSIELDRDWKQLLSRYK